MLQKNYHSIIYKRKKMSQDQKRGEHLNSSPAKHPALSETGICSARN